MLISFLDFYLKPSGLNEDLKYRKLYALERDHILITEFIYFIKHN